MKPLNDYVESEDIIRQFAERNYNFARSVNYLCARFNISDLDACIELKISNSTLLRWKLDMSACHALGQEPALKSLIKIGEKK